MIKNTTPTNEFTFPSGMNPSSLSKIEIAYYQNGKVIFVKNKSDMTISGQKASIELTQEETLKLDSRLDVFVQAKVKTSEGKVLASNIIRNGVGAILNPGVI